MLMDSFEMFFERVKNPLRKAEVSKTTKNKSSIVKGLVTKAKNKPSFQEYSKNFPTRAAKNIENIENKYKSKLFRPSLTPDKYVKVNIKGFDVYFDKDLPMVEDEAAFYKATQTLTRTINKALSKYIKGIVPIRKPKIVITDLSGEDAAYASGGSTPAYYENRLIFIDEYKINKPKLFIHEYAHYLADRVGTQTRPLLIKAYNDMLDDYYNKISKEKIDLQDRKTDSNLEAKNKLRERRRIAKAVGFPGQYGLNNFDEFFAELITNWTTMRKNPVTYKFKQTIKNVISRV
jgi:hypothetical protein